MLAHRVRYHCNYAMGKYKCVCARMRVCARACVCVSFYMYLSPKGYVVSCRFHVRLIVILSVYHVALRSPWGWGYEGPIFFLIDWNWLRGCANLCLEEIRPVERTASSQKVKEKVWISFSSYSMPRRGFSTACSEKTDPRIVENAIYDAWERLSSDAIRSFAVKFPWYAETVGRAWVNLVWSAGVVQILEFCTEVFQKSGLF